MHRKEKNNVPVSNVSDNSGLGVGEMKSLLPAPNITRKFGPNFRRKTKHRYLIRSGFVLVTMVFSFVVLSPSSPLYSNNNDNHRHEDGPESSIPLAGKLSRRLLNTELSTEAPNGKDANSR